MSINENFVGDIEDLISSEIEQSIDRQKCKNEITVRVKRKKPINEDLNFKPQNAYESSIPGTQKVFIKTWGCAHNNSDSEYMAGQLAAYGYNLTKNRSEADIWLLNSCTVKNPSEDTFRNDIESAINESKHVVVAGCVPQGAPKSNYLKDISIIGVQQIDRVVEVVEETLKGHTVRLLQPKKKENGKRLAGAKLDLPKIRKNPLIEIIPINSGCLNQCTYCKTKHARGNLASYPEEEIIARAKQSFNEGVCEIWLTSEDTGTYGRDIGSSLPKLLWKLIDVVPANCKIRIGMTNPPYILEHLEEMAKILNHSKVYSFLHIPVQSGSDSVLNEMKREYNRADFEHIVNFLREKVPGITIATDIICGFPTETEDDFNLTMSLCLKYKFPSLFINQFFPRPGTPAAKMLRIPANLVKKRTKRLTELFKSYQPYTHKINEKQFVLVTEISNDKKYYVGHNKYYEQVLLPMEMDLLGKTVEVQIIDTTKFSMYGKVIGHKDTWKSSVCKISNTPEISNRTRPKIIYDKKGIEVYCFVCALLTLFSALLYRLLIKFL